MKGYVSSIQRMSGGDGPGMRTTVFLKGCPLRCRWCHNPETWDKDPTLGWKEKKCIGCFCCEKACPQNAIHFDEGGLHRDRARCIRCGACRAACPTGAVTWYGEPYEAQALADVLIRDKAFYENSGGGVTLSGGEVLMQAAFARELIQILHAHQIHVALDTCGLGDIQNLLELADLCDLVMFDMKILDSAAHKQATGAGNEKILDNILSVAAQYALQGRSDIWIRTPVIPGWSDDEANIAGIGAFIHENLEQVTQRWDLILFHDMCKEKYRELDMKWPMEGAGLINKAQYQRIEKAAKSSGVQCEKIHLLGLAVDG